MTVDNQMGSRTPSVGAINDFFPCCLLSRYFTVFSKDRYQGGNDQPTHPPPIFIYDFSHSAGIEDHKMT